MHICVNELIMMRKNVKTIVSVLITALLFGTSCGDADLFDSDKWSDQIEGWEPGVSLQVVHGTFTLWDLINQKDSVIIKEGNDLIIQYLKEDIYKLEISEVFDMPKETISFPVEFNISEQYPDFVPGTRSNKGLHEEVIKEINEVPAGCELKKLIASTNLIYNLPYTGFTYNIEATFKNIKDANGDTLRIREHVTDDVDETISLENLVITFEEGHKISLTIDVTILEVQSAIDPSFNLNFSLQDLAFTRVEGKIVQDPIAITPGSFDMNVDFLNEIGGKFSFTKPELNIILRNKGVGVPMQVDATFDGKNKEGVARTLKLNEGKTLVAVGNKTNIVVSEPLGLNAQNSNIVDFLSLPPQGNIDYKGTVTVNPGEKVDNVIYNDAEVTLDALVRIPFSLKAENLTYRDTLNDIDVDQKYADKIKEGTIKIIAENGLPLDLRIPSLILMGENDEEIDRVSAATGKDGLKAAVGNKPSNSTIEFKLTQAQAKNLGKTKKILLEAVASTPQQSEVTIGADAKLSFKLMLQAKAVITSTDDF